MQAIRIEQGKPEYISIDEPAGDGVEIKVVSSSICGSDLHMIEAGWAEGRVLGHEFAGLTPNGEMVAIEPVESCGHCHYCERGYRTHCEEGANIIGVGMDGGMAEFVRVPEQTLVPIPSGLDVANASLVEPLAVAIHGLNRARVSADDKILVIGAGPIGLATAAALQARGLSFDLIARHEHQRVAAERLGAVMQAGEGYDLVFDAVGNSVSVEDSLQRLRPLGRVAMLGTFWDPVALSMAFCAREAELIAAATYQRCQSGSWEFKDAAAMLAANSEIATAMISHRFPLEAAKEAFATASDRAAGAIKVVFDV